jgi:hypothetical protein
MPILVSKDKILADISSQGGELILNVLDRVCTQDD